MAIKVSSPIFFSSSLIPAGREPQRRVFNPRASSSSISRKEDVVIVGAGIAGLATALSLHRLGVRSLVLEQGDSLRTGGTSLTLFKNGWRVLDAIGVGDELRSIFLQIEGLVMRSVDGRELRSFSFEEEAPGQEVRAVERRLLLETLSSRLPLNSISYSSRVKAIQKQETGNTLLELDDGTQMFAKIKYDISSTLPPDHDPYSFVMRDFNTLVREIERVDPVSFAPRAQNISEPSNLQKQNLEDERYTQLAQKLEDIYVDTQWLRGEVGDIRPILGFR